MRNTLLATVAAAAVVGFTTMATAQNAMDSKGTAKPAGAAEEQKAPAGSAGATMHQQPGAQAPAQHTTQGAAPSAKPEQRMGEEQKSQTTAPQRGAASERGADQKKAQDEREPLQKRVQGEAAKPGVSQSNKAEGTANQQNAGRTPDAAGGKVQLSQAQRSKIQSILGKSEAASVRTNVNFNIAVGVTIPHDVHVEVLPEDVVEVVPQYEGYDYVVVGDEILIIDPDSSEIVAIIEA